MTSGQDTMRLEAAAAHDVVSRALLSRAAVLAREGKYAAAESVLGEMAHSGLMTAPAFDLSARIHAQQGRFLEAAGSWKSALAADPGNETYQQGLDRLSRGYGWRRGGPAALIIAGALAIVCVGLLVGLLPQHSGPSSTATSQAGTAISTATASSVPTLASFSTAVPPSSTTASTAPPTAAPPATTPPTASPPTTTPPATTPTSVLPELGLHVPGVALLARADSLNVRFGEGLFVLGARLTPAAQSTLDALGRQLMPHASEITIRVTGCTDDIPVRKGGSYPDNYSLAMARAAAVVDYFRVEVGLPSELFSVRVGNEQGAPYSNSTRDGKLRNRTVVIDIYPRAETDTGPA